MRLDLTHVAFLISHITVLHSLLLLRDCGSFRAVGCGGDGTIGWILQEADKLGVVNVCHSIHTGFGRLCFLTLVFEVIYFHYLSIRLIH